jgi:hypothetical protein
MNMPLQKIATDTCGIWVGLFFIFRGIGEERFAGIFEGIKDKDKFVKKIYKYRMGKALVAKPVRVKPLFPISPPVESLIL